MDESNWVQRDKITELDKLKKITFDSLILPDTREKRELVQSMTKVCPVGKNNGLQDYKQAKLAGNSKIFFTSFLVHAIYFKKLLITIRYLIACRNAREMKWKG